MSYILTGVIFIGHLIFAWRTQIIINKTVLLTEKQQKINSLLNWIIPFIWSLVAFTMLKESKTPTMTKRNRKRSKGGYDDNWYHLTGGGGADSF